MPGTRPLARTDRVLSVQQGSHGPRRGPGSGAPDSTGDARVPECLETPDVTVDAATLPTPTPTPVPAFSAMGLPPRVVDVLAGQGITVPTPVQAAVVPDALSGRDVLGRARTGSGKTLAFGLPVLARLAGGRRRPHAPRALIVLPTRELANQVRAALEPLAHAMQLRMVTVYGGTPYDRQLKRLKQGVDLVVATPGRLDDLIKRRACRLDDVEVVVLDEADHLCDLGFYPAVDGLLKQTPAGGQRMLLSATLDGDVDRLVRAHLHDPARHDLDPDDGGPGTVDHHVLVTAPGAKAKTAATLLAANPRSIVFTRTRAGATQLARSLSAAGVPAVDLHGDLSQRLRERNLRKFSGGGADVGVATDVAARGIHVDKVSLVVHYDVPDDSKLFLHRSGRTARAGQSGAVVTMTTPHLVEQVVRLQRRAGVQARHHDERTAPRPMTVEALAESGSAAPEVSRGHGKSAARPGAGPRNRRAAGAGGHRGRGRTADRPRAGRSRW